MTLLEAFDEYPDIAAMEAILYGTKVASAEAAEEYGEPDDYPEPLRKFLGRAVEVAEEFVNRLDLP